MNEVIEGIKSEIYKELMESWNSGVDDGFRMVLKAMENYREYVRASGKLHLPEDQVLEALIVLVTTLRSEFNASRK